MRAAVTSLSFSSGSVEQVDEEEAKSSKQDLFLASGLAPVEGVELTSRSGLFTFSPAESSAKEAVLLVESRCKELRYPETLPAVANVLLFSDEDLRLSLEVEKLRCDVKLRICPGVR